MLQFLPQHGGIDPQFLRNLQSQFVAGNPAWHSLNVRQKMIDGLYLALRVPRRKHASRPIKQIIEVFLRVLERRAISVFALAHDKQVGIESALQGENSDAELFFDEQAKRALGGARPRRVGIEVDHNILGESSEELSLQFGERRARAGDHVVK